MKPTVIGTNLPKVEPVKPTVIPTDTSQPKAKPTIISSIPSVTAPDKPIVVNTPTAVPGHKRERIEVSVSDLQKFNPGTNLSVLETAVRLIQTTNVENLTDREAIFWGQELQSSYSQLVTTCLTKSQAPVLIKVSGYISRMMEILGSIDLKKVCGLGSSSPDGVISRLVKRATASIDSLEELSQAQVELVQLVNLMSSQLTDLLDLKDELGRMMQRIDNLGDEVEAKAIVAAFLADYLKKQPGTKGELHQRLEERSMSLIQTLGQIRSSGSMRESQVEQPLRLISAVQHTALVMVPGWLSSVVSLKTMLEGQSKPTVTEIGELSDQMQQIVAQLKGN